MERGISPAFNLLEPLLASKEGLDEWCWLRATFDFPFEQRLQLWRQRPCFCTEEGKKRNHSEKSILSSRTLLSPARHFKFTGNPAKRAHFTGSRGHDQRSAHLKIFDHDPDFL